jgi:hypothetical protein
LQRSALVRLAAASAAQRDHAQACDSQPLPGERAALQSVDTNIQETPNAPCPITALALACSPLLAAKRLDTVGDAAWRLIATGLPARACVVGLITCR